MNTVFLQLIIFSYALILVEIVKVSAQIEESLENALVNLKTVQEDYIKQQLDIQDRLESIEKQLTKTCDEESEGNLDKKETEEKTPTSELKIAFRQEFNNLLKEKQNIISILDEIEICKFIKPLSDTKIECESPYVAVGGSCLLIISKSKYIWDEAKRKCEEQGSHMIMYKNANKFQEVMDYLRKHILPDYKYKTPPNYWVGGYKDLVDRQMKWIDGSVMSMSLDIWQHGEPNNHKGREDKVCMYFYTGYYLNDLSSSSSCGVICEMDEKLTTTPNTTISSTPENYTTESDTFGNYTTRSTMEKYSTKVQDVPRKSTPGKYVTESASKLHSISESTILGSETPETTTKITIVPGSGTTKATTSKATTSKATTSKATTNKQFKYIEILKRIQNHVSKEVKEQIHQNKQVMDEVELDQDYILQGNYD